MPRLVHPPAPAPARSHLHTGLTPDRGQLLGQCARFPEAQFSFLSLKRRTRLWHMGWVTCPTPSPAPADPGTSLTSLFSLFQPQQTPVKTPWESRGGRNPARSLTLGHRSSSAWGRSCATAISPTSLEGMLLSSPTWRFYLETPAGVPARGAEAHPVNCVFGHFPRMCVGASHAPALIY